MNLLKTSTAGANVADAFIFIGDSNCKGLINVNLGDVPTGNIDTFPNCYTYFRNDFTTAADIGTWEKYSALPVINNRAPGYARNLDYPVNYGWDVSFVRQYLTESKRPLFLLKFGIAGSSLIARSDTTREWQKSSGGLYNIFRDYFYYPAMNKRAQTGLKPKIKAIVIQLGTNDVFVWNATSFQAAVPLFITNLKNDLMLPLSTPVYWIQVRTDLQTRTADVAPPSGSVAECQMILANCANPANAAYIPGFVLVDDFQSIPIQSDQTHYTSASYDIIGANMKNRLISL